jgi:VWFA-related protein
VRFTPLFLLAFVSLASLAQNSGPVSTIQATTREVVLDVVVTTKDNHPVSGLTKDDFVIEENKAPQQINSFRAVSPATFSDSTAQVPETILLVDQMNTRFPDFAYLRYCMKKLLARNGGHLAQSTTLMALTDKGLKVLAGPTRDGAALESAMEHLHAAIPWRLELSGIYPVQERINLSLGALAEIAMANASAGGRKNIIWISPGFPVLTSLEISPDSQQALFNAIRALSDELLRARISIYTIDPRGVSNTEIYSSSEQFDAYMDGLRASKEVAFGDLALQTLAVQTGGRALYGRNDVDQEIADSIGDGDTYYTLSYSPHNHDFDDKFRKVRILLPRHPELRARTRDGYYALPEPPPPSDKLLFAQLEEALASPLTYHAIPVLDSLAEVIRDPPRTILYIGLSADSFSWAPIAEGRLQANIEVAAADFSPAGKVQHIFSRSYQATIQSEDWKAHKVRIRLQVRDVPVTLPSGRLRVVICDAATGHMGSEDIRNLPEPQKQPASDYLQHRGP